MSLDTQQFGITRYWLAAALKHIPAIPDVFVASKQLSQARKLFLAGKNQLAAIRNWLVGAGVIEAAKGQVKLSELGQLMAAQDPRAESALTWWLFHLHLCVNTETFPYSTFFLSYDAEGRWVSLDDIIDGLHKHAEVNGTVIAKNSIDTYFRGVAQTFHAGGFAHELTLVEERALSVGGKKVRRRLARPDDILVAYAIVLFQKEFYRDQATVEARDILGKGLARALGTRDSDVRESLSRISTNKDLSQYVQYRQQVNQDSIQFLRRAEDTLRDIRISGYQSQAVKWQ
jgi:hypothetical protein